MNKSIQKFRKIIAKQTKKGNFFKIRKQNKITGERIDKENQELMLLKNQ